ncbi:MAG: hypothetical protein FWD13_04730 [Treponema sp.]|nr:hypothetical protein [Treponema sp.]
MRFLNLRSSLFTLCSLFFVLCSFFFTACPNPFFDSEQSPGFQIPAGKGALRLVIDDFDLKAVMPAEGLDQFVKYSLIFYDTLTDNPGEPEIRTNDDLLDPYFLVPGQYSLTVYAFSDIDSVNYAAFGDSENFTINEASVTISTVTLTAHIDEGGDGLFKWNITIPAGLVLETKTIMITNLIGTQIGEVEELLFNTEGVSIGSRLLASGYYRFILTLIKDDFSEEVILPQYLHIYRNMESVFTKVFTNDSFNPIYSGTGAENNPFVINSPELLKLIGSGVFAPNLNYVQTGDIYLTEIDNWTPIGSSAIPFSGTYDGGGFIIYDLKIIYGVEQGLFGYVSGGKIKNLGLVNINITADYYAGGIASDIRNKSEIENCFVTGKIISGDDGDDPISYSYVGGIAGWVQNDSSINNCWSDVDIFTTGESTGGIAGFIDDSSIINCYSLGNVKSESDDVGGIVGTVYDGNIINCYATGTVHGFAYVAGIAGTLYSGEIKNCIALNERISIFANTQHIGRIVSAISQSVLLDKNYTLSTLGLIINTNADGLGGSGLGPLKGHDEVDGEDMTPNAISKPAWETAGFNFNNAPWVWDASGTYMPSLKDVGEPQHWPEWLQTTINVPGNATSLAAAIASINTPGIYNIILSEDQTFSSNSLGTSNTISAPVGTDIRLIAQSSEITIELSNNGRMFTVSNGVTLRLRDGITLQGHDTNTNSLVRVNSGGTLYLEGTAKITGNTRLGGEHGAGVYVASGGVFNMTGGTISGNTADISYGGGVFIEHHPDPGIFNMSGGIISGNTGWMGGGVLVNGAATVGLFGIFNMTGGTISGNTANNAGGGVYVLDGSFKKSPGSGIIYGYDGNNANILNNVVRNQSGIVLNNQGHAVNVNFGARIRDRTVEVYEALDSTIPGAPGGWVDP